MTVPADLLMPKLGLTMEEGRIARWAVRPGERFAAGAVIAVIETDKIASEVEAPAGGEMIELLAPEGSVVPVSTPIARWRLDGVEGAPLTQSSSLGKRGVLPGASDVRSTSAPSHTSLASQPRHPAEPDTNVEARSGLRPLSTPYARRLAREKGLDIATVAGSGPRGRVKAEDVLRAKSASRQSSGISPQATARGDPGPRDHGGIAPDMGPGSRLSAQDRRHAPPGELTARASAGKAQVDAERGTARVLSLAQIEIDTARVREIETTLGGNGGEPLRIALVLMAAARALGVNTAGAIGLETTSDGAARRAVVDVHRGVTLRSAITALDAALADAAETEGGALLVVPCLQQAHFFAPAAPAGWTAALGLGAEREVLKRARGGEIEEAHAMALALSYDPARLTNAQALAFLGQAKMLLEEPLGMLAG